MSTFATGGDIKIKILFTSLFISDGGAYSLPVLPCHCPFHLTARYFTRNDGYCHAGGSIPGLMGRNTSEPNINWCMILLFQSSLSAVAKNNFVYNSMASEAKREKSKDTIEEFVLTL
jgi:hypothetical protein